MTQTSRKNHIITGTTGRVNAWLVTIQIRHSTVGIDLTHIPDFILNFDFFNTSYFPYDTTVKVVSVHGSNKNNGKDKEFEYKFSYIS